MKVNARNVRQTRCYQFVHELTSDGRRRYGNYDRMRATAFGIEAAGRGNTKRVSQSNIGSSANLSDQHAKRGPRMRMKRSYDVRALSVEVGARRGRLGE